MSCLSLQKPTHVIAGLLLLMLMAACTTSRVPPGDTPGQPTLIEQPVLHAGDGTELSAYRWLPAGKPKAIVLMLHGFNEYSGAFDEVGEKLAGQGVAAWAYDQRGFGRSPYRGLWSSAERMAEDAREMTRLLRRQYPGTPLYVMGMSMGGAVTLLAAGEGKLDADGIVLVAPAVWIRATQPVYQRWALDLATKFTPSWSPTGEGLEIRPSDNIPMLRRIWKSPWMIRRSRMDTVSGLVDLMDKAYEAAPGVQVPVLLLYGKKDQLVPEKPVNLLWERLPKTASRTRQIRYPNGWHMLLRDLQGDKVIEDVVRWMADQG